MPTPFTSKHVIDILAKKCNPRPKSATVAAPKTARGKRKAADAPNTSMQETPAQEALRRAAILTRELTLTGNELRQLEARKARREAEALRLQRPQGTAPARLAAPVLGQMPCHHVSWLSD